MNRRDSGSGKGARLVLSAYAGLLRVYPPDFRKQFAAEMLQVTEQVIAEEQSRHKTGGMPLLCAALLWDWGWSAAREWARYFNHSRRTAMDQQIDSQAGDLAWSIATGLRAGYALREIIAQLASLAPEPTASACRKLLAELEAGKEMREALAVWTQTPGGLARLAAALLDHDRAESLDALSQALLRECGSDPAFYPAMREQAQALGAKTPERAQSDQG